MKTTKSTFKTEVEEKRFLAAYKETCAADKALRAIAETCAAKGLTVLYAVDKSVETADGGCISAPYRFCEGNANEIEDAVANLIANFCAEHDFTPREFWWRNIDNIRALYAARVEDITNGGMDC